MSCTNNNNMNQDRIKASITTVDDISNDIGRRMGISKGGEDISEIDISGGVEEKIGNKKCISCEQKLDNKTHGTLSESSSKNNNADMVSGDIGSDIDAKDICANCGKDGASNVCNKCKLVKYCNAVCKKKHKKKHKKECEEYVRHAAKKHEEEVRRAAELHDKELFKEPPQQEEECPICLVRLPRLNTGKMYKACCGKVICIGCVHAVVRTRTRKTDIPLCPFCRTLEPTSGEEVVKRVMKRVDAGDAQGIASLGFYYYNGIYGLPQDHAKALELWRRAAELGHVTAYFNIGCNYAKGQGVDRDMKKAEHYSELAAMGGHADARHNLGMHEWNRGNEERAIKHFMIAAKEGNTNSLTSIQKLYSNGDTTKDVYTQALRSYQKYLAEVKSSQRDEAAAFDEGYKYI